MPVLKEIPMHSKLTFSTVLALLATPALAHPEHGFQLPSLLHVITEADHLAIAVGAGLVVALLGRLVFKRSRK
jgi:hydrogenase/urease accessory protein HupE